MTTQQSGGYGEQRPCVVCGRMMSGLVCSGCGKSQPPPELMAEVAARREDSEFMDRLTGTVREHRELLDRLSEPPEDEPLIPDAYSPIERTDTLVRCNRCGAVVEGDVLGQNLHDIWHDNLDQRVRKAWMPPRYGGR